jgi:Lipid A 3-O-deacylase (PagL)
MRRAGVSAAILLFAATALAAEEIDRTVEAPTKTKRGLRWSVAAGYGFSVKLSRGRAEEHSLLVAPAAAYPLSRRFELVAEAHLQGFFTPDGYMLGLVPIGARYFFSDATARPYLALGAGFGWTNLDELDELDRRFNYMLQACVGVLFDRGGGSGWTLEARLSHISNAGTVLPNLGLNSVVFLGGWRFP